jgi:hypothetical protein
VCRPKTENYFHLFSHFSISGDFWEIKTENATLIAQELAEFGETW